MEKQELVRTPAPASSKPSPRSSVPVDGVAANVPRRRPPGRTRSDTARLAILNAAMKLLEKQTLQQITIESIAREAGVGKATIYRWWSSKASVVIEAFVQNHIVHTPMPTGVSSIDALTHHMHSLIQQYSGWPGRVVAQILAEGQSDPQVLREFRERFFYGRRAMVGEVLEEGRRRGEIRTDIDADMQMDVLYASIYFRLMMQHLPLDHAYADLLSGTMLKIISVSADIALPSELPDTKRARRPAGKPVRD